MIIGVPKEIKVGEFRVAMTPDGVRALARAGHEVRVQTGAGEPSGFSDSEYRRAGAKLASIRQVWSADLVIKVKEPLPSEFARFRSGQILFAFLHLAPNRPLTLALIRKKVIGLAYETVETAAGKRPLLRAMSEIAGRVAVVMGYYFQGNPQGGRGVLYGGIREAAPAHVVILGGGIVGEQSAIVASSMGSKVTLLERFPARIRYLKKALPKVHVVAAASPAVRRAVLSADILIGALHIPGARTPRLVSRAMVRKMKPRSVIVDVAIDQGGSCETSRPTSHLNPIYMEEGVLHYCVPNIPGAYSRTSTLALTHASLPYVKRIAALGVLSALTDPGLAKGVQCYEGHITCAPVAAAHGLPSIPLLDLL